MKKAVFIMASCALLSACKLGGSAEGVSDKVTLIELGTSEAITIVKEGPFQFQYEFEAGQGYDVSLDFDITQQSCTIKNQSGVFIDQDVNNVLVECKPTIQPYTCNAGYHPYCTKRWDNQANAFKYQTSELNCDPVPDQRMVVSRSEPCEFLEGKPANSAYPVQVATWSESDESIDIVEASIQDHMVELNVEYVGCPTDYVVMGVNNQFSESVPPGARVVVKNTEKEPACTETVTRTLRFDLMPIQEHYYKQYGTGTGSLMLEGVGLYEFE